MSARVPVALLLVLALAACTAEEPAEPPATEPPPHHAATTPQGYAAVELGAERAQRFGVRTERAERAALTREVRTVGIVRTDETRESHVHVKWSGWIEEFHVSFVGQRVAKGDPLFSVYSPELVTAQQELLIAAARAVRGADAGGGALRETARQKLLLWDVPEELIARIEKEGRIQRAVTVRAPRAGTVIAKMALPGMYVEPSMDLYTIADLSRVWVLADLYEYEIPFASVGQRATFAPVGVTEPEAEIAATVAFVDPTVDPMTRTVRVRLEVPNPDGRLRPGTYGTARLEVPLAEAVAVPTDAIIDTGERKIAFVHAGDGRFEPRALRLGARAGERVQVLEGLAEGEEVVTRAQFLLDSESRLRAATPRGPAHGGHEP